MDWSQPSISGSTRGRSSNSSIMKNETREFKDRLRVPIKHESSHSESLEIDLEQEDAVVSSTTKECPRSDLTFNYISATNGGVLWDFSTNKALVNDNYSTVVSKHWEGYVGSFPQESKSCNYIQTTSNRYSKLVFYTHFFTPTFFSFFIHLHPKGKSTYYIAPRVSKQPVSLLIGPMW